MNWGQRLLGRGGLLLQGLGPILDEVDPVGTIRPASRLLCAGLAELAGSVWSARAEGPPPARLLEAAALLALLLTPQRNGTMITAAQYIGHGHAAEIRRARVVRMLKQQIAMAFFH